MAGLTQRADEVMQAVAPFQLIKLHGAGSQHLIDDADAAAPRVRIHDREGDALGVLPRPQDDKLAHFGFFSHERGLDINAYGCIVQPGLVDDLIHALLSPSRYLPRLHGRLQGAPPLFIGGQLHIAQGVHQVNDGLRLGSPRQYGLIVVVLLSP